MKRHCGKTYTKLLVRTFSLLLAATLTLTGCGVGPEDSSENRSVSMEPPVQAIDWDNYQMAEPQNVTEGYQWYLTEYHDDWLTPPEKNYKASGILYAPAPGGDIYYKLEHSSGSVAEGNYITQDYIDYFDVQTGQSLHVAIHPDQWGLPENTYLLDMDVADNQLMVFLFRSVGKPGTSLSCCTLVFYHLEDGLQNTLDLLPSLAEAGITEETELILDSTKRNFLYDPNGCGYLIWEGQLVVVSDTGELLCHMGQGDEPSPSYLCKTSAGFPIFTTKDKTDRSTVYWAYDSAAGEMRSLGKSPNVTLKYSCMDTAGNLYYFEGDKIIRWNTLSGVQETIFDCNANNICSNTTAPKIMAIRENGDLVILDTITDNRNIYILSSEPPESSTTLTLVSCSFEDPLEQAAAIRFSMKHPGAKIEYSNADSAGASNWEEAQAYANNLINRIVAGDAPDMFIVSAENMQILYEKGALMDLTGIIPPETREQVFDGIWNAGTIDGKLIGLTTNLSSSSILVSDEIWPYDTWTLEDILTLAENAPKDTLKGLIPLYGFRPLASDALDWLALMNIDSSLVDRESGTCHFDSQQFRKLLEYCKNTPIPEPDPNIQNPAPAQAVKNGEYLAYACSPYGFTNFSFQMSLFPENYHWVGVPTRGESGNLSTTGFFLVVSKDTEHMDLIKEFLPLIYDYDLARQYPWQCLRKDVLRERVSAPGWGSSVQFNMGEGKYLVLEGKPDGTSYVEEYIDFLDSSVPMPYEDRVIADIVLEETAPYFAGDKDMDTVIDIIQNRVQLYLNENRP